MVAHMLLTGLLTSPAFLECVQAASLDRPNHGVKESVCRPVVNL